MTTAIGKKFFAVTDQHVIIHLEVATQRDIEDYIVVETKIIKDQDSDHRQAHHDAYFKKLYLDKDGSISNKPSVFTDLELATKYAVNNINEELEHKQRQQIALEKRRNQLLGKTETNKQKSDLSVLATLVEDVEAAGGLVTFSDGLTAPMCDLSWVDLGSTVLKAHKSLKAAGIKQNLSVTTSENPSTDIGAAI